MKPKKPETFLVPLPRSCRGTLVAGMIDVFNEHGYEATLAIRPRGRGVGMTLECRRRSYPGLEPREEA